MRLDHLLSKELLAGCDVWSIGHLLERVFLGWLSPECGTLTVKLLIVVFLSVQPLFRGVESQAMVGGVGTLLGPEGLVAVQLVLRGPC